MHCHWETVWFECPAHWPRLEMVIATISIPCLRRWYTALVRKPCARLELPNSYVDLPTAAPFVKSCQLAGRKVCALVPYANALVRSRAMSFVTCGQVTHTHSLWASFKLPPPWPNICQTATSLLLLLDMLWYALKGDYREQNGVGLEKSS